MKSEPQVVVVASDRERLQELAALARHLGLEPYLTSSPSSARGALVCANSLVLALCEWDGDMPYRDRLAGLFSELDRVYPTISVMVSGHAIYANGCVRTIHLKHPTALTHDRTLNDSYLAMRLESIFGRRVGDLHVRGGVLIHTGSGEALSTNKVAVKLLLAAPHAVRLEGPSVSMAILRLRRWLRELGSCVEVETVHGTGEYKLVVKGSHHLAQSFNDVASSERLAS